MAITIWVNLFGMLILPPALTFATPPGTGVGVVVAAVAGGANAWYELRAESPEGVAVEPVAVEPVAKPAEPPAGGSTGLDALIAVKDKMCACDSLACVAGLKAEMDASARAMAADPSTAAADARRVQAVTKEMTDCMRALATGGR